MAGAAAKLGRLDRWLLWEDRPYLFAQQALGLEGDRLLELLLTSADPQIIELAARQTGKTTRFACKATHHSLFAPQTLTLVVSATQRQAGILQRRVTTFLRMLARQEQWRSVKQVEAYEYPEDQDPRLVRCSVLSLELGNGSEVVSVPASPDTVRGYSPHLVIIDEAAWVPIDVFDVVTPMLAVTQGQLIVGSSAGYEVGWFYDLWRTDAPGWRRSEMTAWQCERIPRDWLERKREELASRPLIFQREYENKFMAAEGTLLSADVVRDMFTPAERAIRWGEPQKSESILVNGEGVRW